MRVVKMGIVLSVHLSAILMCEIPVDCIFYTIICGKKYINALQIAL